MFVLQDKKAHWIVPNYWFQPFLGFMLHNLHCILTMCFTAPPLTCCLSFSLSHRPKQLQLTHYLVSLSLSPAEKMFHSYVDHNTQRSHQTSALTQTSTSFARDCLCFEWQLVGYLYYLTWLAPHNELSDSDCQHCLIILIGPILSVMSYFTIFLPMMLNGAARYKRGGILAMYCVLYILYILYCHFDMGRKKVLREQR